MKHRKVTCIAILFVLFHALAIYADDAVGPFTFKTLDGKVLESKTMKGTPLIINVGAHW